MKQSPIEEWSKLLQRWQALLFLVSKVSSCFGVIVKDRIVDDTVLDRCFVGKQCVDWIYDNLQMDLRLEAVQLTTKMIKTGLVVGVTTNDKWEVDSEHSLYRFNTDKIREWTISYQDRVRTPEKEAPTPEEDDSDIPENSRNLSEHDWHLLLSGCKKENYQKDQTILTQGIHNSCIYRIHKGRVKVEFKDRDEIVTEIKTIGAGHYFGELSVLTNKKTSAGIKAEMDSEIYYVDYAYMSALFAEQPGIQRRFYENVALKIGKMLRDLGSNKNSRFATLKKPIKDITANSKDKQFIELFNLKEENEVLIQEYSCFMKGIVKEYGRLYVSSHYVCYFSQVFGKRTRIALPIATIENVTCDVDKKKILIKAKKKKLVLRGFGDPRSTMDLILSVRDKTKLRDSNTDEKTFLSVKESEGLLTTEDWNILLNGASHKVYKKDETILNANIRSTKLFQIIKGSCRVQKKEVLGKMETGEIFGEINFLDGEGTSASVVADEEETEVLVMRRSALKILFIRHPALAGRFYHYLSTILSIRFKERELAYLDPNI